MIKKYFIQLYSDDIGYGPIPNFYTMNFALQYLWFSLYRSEYDWIHITKLPEKIIYWSWDDIKQKADIQFDNLEGKKSFDEEYSVYSKKRWQDMPTLEMTIQNYEAILEKWSNILKTKPNFIILSQDDSGYVDLIGKDELSEKDLIDMKNEHEKYLKYKIAYDKYVKSRPDIVDDLWHGPESSEYEADWQKFYETEDKK